MGPRMLHKHPHHRYHTSWVYLLAVSFLCLACGDPQVQVTNTSYEPRIVIRGLLMPDHAVNEIHIARNFRLDEDLRGTSLLLPEAVAVIIDQETAKQYPLTFVPADLFGPLPDYSSSYFAYQGEEELAVRHGATYRLEVSAEIEGEELFAHATTTVPEPGFRIADLSHDRYRYRERDPDDGGAADPVGGHLHLRQSVRGCECTRSRSERLHLPVRMDTEHPPRAR